MCSTIDSGARWLISAIAYFIITDIPASTSQIKTDAHASEQ